MSDTPAMRDAFDPIVRGWHDVAPRRMFGSHVYFAGDRMFAILHATGIIIRATVEDADVLLEQYGASRWTPRPGQRFGLWIEVPCPGEPAAAALSLEPFLRNACEAARSSRRKGSR